MVAHNIPDTHSLTSTFISWSPYSVIRQGQTVSLIFIHFSIPILFVLGSSYGVISYVTRRLQLKNRHTEVVFLSPNQVFGQPGGKTKGLLRPSLSLFDPLNR
uniref:Uncharacterized protein n=1 Tax=Picea glauca TaxID=3330 RepID=A0A101LVC2_PICGL|nr:hypothetical protein ABT39_MTgene2137 [Picea glauca]QHR86894.1 hypothetical protein Q903MT_gene901 [Picea sitchensis]